MKVEIFTDGACSGNPGPGGWAAVLTQGEHRLEISGFEEETTNNRMELRAAIEGLAALKRPCTVTLYSDSTYLVNAFNKHWIYNWQRNGWLTASKQPVENQDCWRSLLEHCRVHDVSFQKVPGHAQCIENNRCDKLAREAISNYSRKASFTKK